MEYGNRRSRVDVTPCHMMTFWRELESKNEVTNNLEHNSRRCQRVVIGSDMTHNSGDMTHNYVMSHRVEKGRKEK